jgi:hypothetical protein
MNAAKIALSHKSKADRGYAAMREEAMVDFKRVGANP